MIVNKTDNLISAFILAVLVLSAVTANAMTRIQDIARPLGERGNIIVGTGLVFGLNGTGDGDQITTATAVQAWLRNAGNPVDSIDDIKNLKNVAYVTLSVDLSRNGINNGDELDVTVDSFGKASSLAGGTLFATPLNPIHDPGGTVYGFAQGKITLPDPKHPTSGIIKGGAIIEVPHHHEYVKFDSKESRFYFDLVLDEGFDTFQVAQQLVVDINAMNEIPGGQDNPDYIEALQSARALDAKTVRVYIPKMQVDKYTSYIARILNLPIETPEPEAVVVINESSGTMAFGGNVEILPCVITVDGMNIEIVKPKPVPQPGVPVVSNTEFAAFDTSKESTLQLADLIEDLDQLKVPFHSKVQAIYRLQRGGWLKAKVITE